MKNGLIKKFLDFALGNLVVLILGFISSPIITRIIIPEEFGKFSMFNTITSLFLIIVTLGLDQAYVRFYYEENENARKKLLWDSIKIPLLLNIALSIMTIILYKPISKFVIGEYSFLVSITIIICNTFNIIGRYALLVVRMKQKGKIYSFLQVIGKVIYIALALLIYKMFNRDSRTLIIALTCSNVLVAIAAMIGEREQWFSSKKNITTKVSTKDMVLFGSPLIFSMAITWIFQSIDRIFINAFCGYNEVGVYSAAFSIIALLNAVQAAFTTFWVPVANERYKENPNNTNFYTKVNGIVSLIMISISILLITFKDILILLLGAKYRGAMFIFPFLVFMPLMYTVSETTVLGINFKMKTKYHIYIALTSAIVNILGNLLLVPLMESKGAAISTGISYIVFFAMRTYFSKKLYNVDYNLKRFFLVTILLVIIATYSSFNGLNIISIGLGIISNLIVLFLYSSSLSEIIKSIKNTIKLR